MSTMLSRKRRHRPVARRGAAAVELAVVLPLLLYLFMATADFGRIFYYSLTLANCARHGALYSSGPLAAAESPYASGQEAALADATILTPSPVVTSSVGTDAGGNPYVAVTASYTFQSITSYPGIPSSVNLARTVQMRVAPLTGP
jgi:Flp pilus assembly protein TadG